MEELVALAIHSSTRWMRRSPKPIFAGQPSAYPPCISHHMPGIAKYRRWGSLHNLVTELYEGRTCCTRYRLVGEEQKDLAVFLLQEWREKADISKWQPEPRIMTVYEIYCNRCPAWRKPVPTQPCRPILPPPTANPPSTASGSASRSREAEADRPRTSTARSSDRTSSSPRRHPAVSQEPRSTVHKVEPREPDHTRSRRDTDRRTSDHRPAGQHSRKDQPDRSSSRDTHYQSDRSSSRDAQRQSDRPSSRDTHRQSNRPSSRDSHHSTPSTSHSTRREKRGDSPRVPRSHSSGSSKDRPRESRESDKKLPTEKASRPSESRSRSNKRKSPDPPDRETQEAADDIGPDVVLPEHVTRLLEGDIVEPAETPATKRRKSDSATPPPEEPEHHVPIEVDVTIRTEETMDRQPSLVVEVSEEVPVDDAFEAGGDSEKIDLSTPMQIPESPAPTAEPSTPTPEPSVPTPEPTVSTPESSVPAQEPPMTAPEPVTHTPEPTASAPESVTAKESSADPSFVKLPEWTEIKRPPTAEGGAIPKKAATSTEKKQKSRAKAQERNPFEQIMQQTAPRVPFSLGYIDEDGYEPLVMSLCDTSDAEYYVQSQYNLYLTEMRHIHVSEILVRELRALTPGSDLGEEFATQRAQHILAFVTAVDQLHQRSNGLYAVPKLRALFPTINQYCENIPLPGDDDYALFRRRVIAIGRMLNGGGEQANSKGPVGAIHEVCYAFILRMRTYYTNISWTDIEPKAEEFQIDAYSALLADPSTEEAYRHAWTPLPRTAHPEPRPQGFGAPPPWTRRETAADATNKKPSSPPPPPPPRPRVTRTPLSQPDHYAIGRGRGRGNNSRVGLTSQPPMPRPPGVAPGPQPPGYSKASPELEVIGTIPAKPSTKTHPARVFGEKDRKRVRMPRTMPFDKMPPTELWEAGRLGTAEELRATIPDFREDLLKRICYETEIACLRLEYDEDIPVWAPEIYRFHEFTSKWGHPITHQRVPALFVIRFLQRSLLIPERQSLKKKSFIAPIIPWEFSRDAFLPRGEQIESWDVDEYDKAWACMRAITYHLQILHQNQAIPQNDGESQDDYDYRRDCLLKNLGRSYIPSMLTQAYNDACRPAGFHFDLSLLRPFDDMYGVFVRPFMPLYGVSGEERQLRAVEDSFSCDAAYNPIAFSGREWGAPLTDEIIALRRANLRQDPYSSTKDRRAPLLTVYIKSDAPPIPYAECDDREVWYYDGVETYLEPLPGSGNYEKPKRPYPLGLHKSPMGCRETHIAWRAKFHNWNCSIIRPRVHSDGRSWITQKKGVAYRLNQVTRATQYDLAEASANAGPRSRPNVDYEIAVHRSIYCDKDEDPSRSGDYYACPHYRWSDAEVWREDTNKRLTLIQEDWNRRRSPSEPPPSRRERVASARWHALPRSLSEPPLHKLPRRWRDRREPEEPKRPFLPHKNDAASPMEVEPNQSTSADARPSTSRQSTSKANQPRAKLRFRPRVRGPLKPRYENVGFTTRSSKLNNRFSQAPTSSVAGLVRDHQHEVGYDNFMNHDERAGMPPAPPHKIRHWRRRLKDLKTKTRPYVLSKRAMRKPEIALQGSNGIIRGHQIESFQGTINLRDSVTGKRHTIVCTDPISIVEPRPVLSVFEKEPPPPLLLYSTDNVHVSTGRQVLIEKTTGDPDGEDTFFKVWSGRPEG